MARSPRGRLVRALARTARIVAAPCLSAALVVVPATRAGAAGTGHRVGTTDQAPPSAPANLTATATAGSVSLGWNASTDNVGVAGYRVLRSGVQIAAIGPAESYTDTTISPGVTYTYTVQATDAAGNVSASSFSAAVTPMAAYDPDLTRAPYLTDLVNLSVAVNWATNQSVAAGSVRFGAVDATGSCQLTSTVTASKKTILVGAVNEYQWVGNLTVPTAATYCYRVYLGAIDLLGANASPTFATQVPFGATQSYSFDVLGDWGEVDANGQNPDQANLMEQVAASGARFAVTTGDNGYPNGSQINYGDLQQSGAATSAIFGPSFWTVPGRSIPLFTAAGNHGLSGTQHTDITTWTEATAVSTSGGRYQNDLYCCVNGSNPSNYGSEWYAFTAGNARFYILDAAWGDTNPGTASPYANDALAHFAPGDPEHDWLVNDLETHPTQLKFAFIHYPLYSDNPSQPSDTYLDGATNLEGLLGQAGVQIAFDGHAHIYERNHPSSTGMPATYVTGGGGSTLEPVGPCQAYDQYAIGWSPSSLTGTACGSAHAPTAAAQVYHFLKVTVSGTSVTVAPTDSTGHTFDVQTYNFKVATDTYIDSAPPAGTTSTDATFTFHASGTPSTYTCQLDAAAPSACTSPVTYTGLTQGAHTFEVAATVGHSTDPAPAVAAWTVDWTPPSPPGDLSATVTSPFTVGLSWSLASDNTGVTGYDIYRNGVLYKSLGPVPSYTDAVLGGSTYSYYVDARDVAGNVSPPSSPALATTPAPPTPVFADGFESGDLRAWTSAAGLTVESTTVHSGTFAAEGNVTTGNTFAKETLPSTYTDAYARVWFDVVSQLSQVNLLRLRDSAGASLGYVYVDTTGQLGYHNDAVGTNTVSDWAPSPGWHALELHLKVGPTGGAVEVWLDDAPVADLSSYGIDTGSSSVATMQIGEVQAGRTYDVVFDDAGFGTSRLGPVADATPPPTPTGVSASAVSAFATQVSWAADPGTDVTTYDIVRDGAHLASVPATTSTYVDDTVLAGSTHAYSVDGRDGSGNVSPPSDPISVTTPSSATPLFADGFETGDLSAWTTASGLTPEGSTVESGSWAASGDPTSAPAFAKKTVGSANTDVYAQVAFDVVAQGSQVTLLRLRNTPTGSGGYLYLTAAGRLAFRSDYLASGSVSGTTPSSGWHLLELHLDIDTGTVEVWLDGVPVTALDQVGVNLGTAPLGVLQIGDTASGTWNVAFDDGAFGTSRIGTP